MIQVKDVFKEYPGGVKALQGVSFEIRKGEICGYIGANGAGKSTTIKILCGMLDFDSGGVSISGIDVKKNPVEVKKLIGYVPETGNLFNSLTPVEFLYFIGDVRGIDKETVKKRVNGFSDLFDIKKFLDTSLSSLSKGTKQKVLIISALLHDPEIIFLDEPINGLDAESIFVFQDLIKELSQRGKTVFYCSHLLDTIEKISTRILLLNNGKIEINKLTSELKGSKDYTNLENLFKDLKTESAGKKFSYEEIFG